MSRNNKNTELHKSIPKPMENGDEATFQYSLELLAPIAARFSEGGVTDVAATLRAIKLLDAVSATIEGKTIQLRARKNAERLSVEVPKHLEFAKGIRYITSKGTETNATKAFRDYLRLSLRLSALGHPSRLTDQQMEGLMYNSANNKAQREEDQQIEELIKGYRDTGFDRFNLVKIKESYDRLRVRLVNPYQNSAKGKKGGRPRGGKKKAKKVLAAKFRFKK